MDDDGHPSRLQWSSPIPVDDETRELKVNTAQGKGLIEAVGHLLAVLAHEVRNPLNNASNAVALIERSPEDRGMVVNCAQVMKRQISRISRLVDDLFDLSTINQGKMRLEHQPVSVNRIVELAVEDAACEMETKNHNFTVSPLEKDVCVSGDENRLLQVFCNLLSNAAKYTDDNGEVHFSAVAEGDEVVFRVQDNGIGISSSAIETIFDLFIQENREEGRGGIGIGLALVKRLVELHGGAVGVWSAGPGQGATFYVKLPILSQDSSEVLEEQEGRPRRILLVEDNPDSAKALEQILSIEGHQVRTALDGRHAIQAVDEEEPEIVLLDLGLPDMDGEEVASYIRRKCPYVCLVALTGYASSDVNGVDFQHFLTKPVDMTKLFRLLKSCEAGAA